MALVLVVTVLFWIIGRVRGPESPLITQPAPTSPTPTVTSEPTTPTPATPTGLTAAPAPTPTLTPSPTVTIPPSEITVQILDAAGDGGSAASDLGRRLRQAGYRVVATNQAVRTYQRSTLFYTQGHEADARVIQRDFPEFVVVDEKPANLSGNVDVHAVVGRDYEPRQD